MRYVCDAPGGKTWFRIETEAEASMESEGMRHAVEKEEAAVEIVAPLMKKNFQQLPQGRVL